MKLRSSPKSSITQAPTTVKGDIGENLRQRLCVWFKSAAFLQVYDELLEPTRNLIGDYDESQGS